MVHSFHIAISKISNLPLTKQEAQQRIFGHWL